MDNQPYQHEQIDQPEAIGVDYLNQIAPPQVDDTGFSRKTKLIILGLVIVCAASLLMVFDAAKKSDKSPSLLRAAVHVQKVQNISVTYKPKLRSSKLQDLSSKIIAISTTTNKLLEKEMAATGVDAKLVKKQLAGKNLTTELETNLNDAYLNAELDQAYTREVLYLVDSIIAELKAIEKSNKKSASLKELTTKSLRDFSSLRKSLTELP